MKEVYIGIDLAWGEKNRSGFCVLTPTKSGLKIVTIKLLLTLDEIIKEISIYLTCKVSIGIDAPLIIANDTGNRAIEKEFNKDFAPYKIAMLPVNRNLLTKYTSGIRSETLFKALTALGFEQNQTSSKTLFEVYPHSTIAICFNQNKILKYKRKKGRSTDFIKIELEKYKNYLLHVIETHVFFDTDISKLKGQGLKDFEDMLDAITCGYSLYYCKKNPCKMYQLKGVDTFITPIPHLS